MFKITKKEESLTLNLSVNRYMLATTLALVSFVMSIIINKLVDLLLED